MEEYEVKQLACSGSFDHESIRGKVEETHISWVIIGRRHAFKIKKPVKLPFLDFSTLALRKRFCEREVVLNNRFSHIYLSVQPICLVNDKWHIGRHRAGSPVDYCVVMKRMALSKRMDNQLRHHTVTKKNITALALEVAAIHRDAEPITTPFRLEEARKLFNDIALIGDYSRKLLGERYASIIRKSIDWSDDFLSRHIERFQQRIDEGYKRDVHGDLHSGNIFLYKRPVLFDCIEFNDQFRQIDVLYEIAFLCMDLEAFQQLHLSKYFVYVYEQQLKIFQAKEDQQIFEYFKCLRANVRAKVHSMAAQQADSQEELIHHENELKKYLDLLERYRKSSEKTQAIR